MTSCSSRPGARRRYNVKHPEEGIRRDDAVGVSELTFQDVTFAIQVPDKEAPKQGLYAPSLRVHAPR